MKKIILILTLLFTYTCFAQSFTSKSKIYEPTSYLSMMEFLQRIAKNSDIIKLDYLGVSYLGRKIPYITINSGTAGNNKKVKFLIFAQQHGNEPSGKEALLAMLNEFSSGLHKDWLKNIELIIVPQVNPDGSELQQRLTANNVDLNRSHVNLRNPEVLGLQKLFYNFMPEVTLDVHETNYYRADWLKWGFIKTARQNMGIVTNPNIAESIFKLANLKALPFVKQYLNKRGYSFSNYLLGNWNKGKPVRFSNLGIYDGRQSMGIYNTLSFIIEGKNGRNITDSLTVRRNGQLANIKGLIEFINKNVIEIKKTVADAREKLVHAQEGEQIIIRSKFVTTDSLIRVMMINIKSNSDTLMSFRFGGKVKPTLIIKKPKGYLVPKYDNLLIELLKSHHIKLEPFKLKENENVYEYKIFADSTQIKKHKNFKVEKKQAINIKRKPYYFVPINQAASNFICLIFEPQSQCGVNSKYGLISDRKLSYFLDENNIFNILRVETK